jgi:hypothetical protein
MDRGALTPEALLDALRSSFEEPLSDGRTLSFRLDSAKNPNIIRARVSGYGDCKEIATIVPSHNGYILDDTCGSGVFCWTFEDVASELKQLAIYSSRCWNCGEPVVLSTATRCPKCRRFVLCTCGMCLCDKFAVRRALTPEELANLISDLNRRFGHVLSKKDE